MCVVDADGVRGRDQVALPAPCSPSACAASSASQELTVDAAITGDRDAACRRRCCSTRSRAGIDYDHVAQMTDEMLDATAAWLPQFSKLSSARH